MRKTDTSTHDPSGLAGRMKGPQRQRTAQPLAASQIPDALLKLRTVTAVTGLSEATIRRRAASDPSFPKLLRNGARCTRIRAGDLMTWMAKQAA